MTGILQACTPPFPTSAVCNAVPAPSAAIAKWARRAPLRPPLASSVADKPCRRRYIAYERRYHPPIMHLLAHLGLLRRSWPYFAACASKPISSKSRTRMYTVQAARPVPYHLAQMLQSGPASPAATLFVPAPPRRPASPLSRRSARSAAFPPTAQYSGHIRPSRCSRIRLANTGLAPPVEITDLHRAPFGPRVASHREGLPQVWR